MNADNGFSSYPQNSLPLLWKKKKDIKAFINFWYELPTFEWKDKQGKVRREFEATWKRSIFTADQ